jgi:hypothetical protein
VLRGECLLIVEGQEMQLQQWDYFHCPPDVAHAIVGAGRRPSLVLAVGNRLGPDVIVYPRDETALKHGAGVEQKYAAPEAGLLALHETGALRSIPGGVPDRLARRESSDQERVCERDRPSRSGRRTGGCRGRRRPSGPQELSWR